MKLFSLSNSTKYLSIICVGLLLIVQTAYAQEVKPDSHNSRNSIDWAATYQGITPCADCQGIKTLLTLLKNGKYVLSTLYIDRDKSPRTVSGKFTWDNSGNIVTLDVQGGSRSYRVGEGRLMQLSADGAGNTVAELTKSPLNLSAANSVSTLEGNRWTLTSATTSRNKKIDIITQSKDQPVVFTFAAGLLSVRGPCNLMSGHYAGGSSRIVIGPMRSTMRACDASVMNSERLLSDMLSGPLQVSLNGGDSPRLRLVTATSGTLSFAGEPMPESLYGPARIIFIEVAHERIPCSNPNGEKTCLQVRDRFFDEQGLQSSEPGPWRPLYERIDGYTHVPGQSNVIRVKSFTRPGTANLYILDLVVRTDIVK